jgi:hypothetical protein
VAVTLAIVAVGFAVFYLAAKYLPIFESAEHEREALSAPQGQGVAVRGV